MKSKWTIVLFLANVAGFIINNLSVCIIFSYIFSNEITAISKQQQSNDSINSRRTKSSPALHYYFFFVHALFHSNIHHNSGEKMITISDINTVLILKLKWITSVPLAALNGIAKIKNLLNTNKLPLVRQTDSLEPLVELMLLCLYTQLNIAMFWKSHRASVYTLLGNQATNYLHLTLLIMRGMPPRVGVWQKHIFFWLLPWVSTIKTKLWK